MGCNLLQGIYNGAQILQVQPGMALSTGWIGCSQIMEILKQNNESPGGIQEFW